MLRHSCPCFASRIATEVETSLTFWSLLLSQLSVMWHQHEHSDLHSLHTMRPVMLIMQEVLMLCRNFQKQWLRHCQWMRHQGTAMLCILYCSQCRPSHCRELQMCNWVNREPAKPLLIFFQRVDDSNWSAEEREVIRKIQHGLLFSKQQNNHTYIIILYNFMEYFYKIVF